MGSYFRARDILDKAMGTDSYFQIKSILFGLKAADVAPVRHWRWVDENENPVTVPMIEDMVYNHVALMSQNLTGTTTGEIKAPIVADAKQSASTTFDISNGVKGSFLQNELIQDKSKLKVVAMLINTETGEIVNADEKEIAAYDPTGIENVTATGEEAVEVARYALDGTQLSVPTKGVNIVKMSDGTTKKVIVK